MKGFGFALAFIMYDVNLMIICQTRIPNNILPTLHWVEYDMCPTLINPIKGNPTVRLKWQSDVLIFTQSNKKRYNVQEYL